MNIDEVDPTTKEGKMLLMAISIIRVESRDCRTPNELIEFISNLVDAAEE